MKKPEQFQACIHDFFLQFSALASRYDGTTQHSSELEALIDEYAAFVTDDRNKPAWEQVERQASGEFRELVGAIRRVSAKCVAIMEKYRALKLLVGSGSYPMTPLLIAKRTGAMVVGIDIDEEAVSLGKQVVEILGSELPIRLEHQFIEQLDVTKEASYIIFSSTVPNKYELLDQLYALTNEQVVVVMRYGDRLKSLFNYPMQEVDGNKWRLVDTVLRPDHIFDIALYQKAVVGRSQNR